MTSLVAQNRRRFLLQKTPALLVAAVLAVPAASAETVVVQAGWGKARTMLAQGDYRPKIRVELHSSERLKGKLAGTTDAGLRLVRRGTETSIAREEIRTIRLRPRKTTRTKYRLLGLLAGIPAGFWAGGFSSLACCLHDGASASEALGAVVFFGVLIAVPYWFYKLGARADRGAVLIVLDERAPDSSRDGSQAERPSSAKGEQP